MKYLCLYSSVIIFVLFTSAICYQTTIESNYVRYLPDCNRGELEKYTLGFLFSANLTLVYDFFRNYFIVSTLDGKISKIDGVSGALNWSKQVDTGPLISSTLRDYFAFNHREFVQMLVSLDGNIYVSNGRSIKKTNFNAEKLIKNSIKFSENVLLAGGQENTIVGMNLSNGEIVYECGQKGCQQNASIEGNIILLQKSSQTVRAINALSGEEEWHFIVNNPQLLRVTNQDCSNEKKDSYYINYKVFAPTGYLTASVYLNDNLSNKQLVDTWHVQLDSPIVNIWHYQDNDVHHVNLFKSSTMNFEKLITNGEFREPNFYIGNYKDQLYIQKSIDFVEESLLTHEDSSSEIPLLENKVLNHEEIQTNIKMKIGESFDLTNVKSTNLIGYYVVSNISEGDKCLKETPNLDDSITDDIVPEIVYITNSISFYWKEILVICITSWFFLFFSLKFVNRVFSNVIKKKLVSDTGFSEETEDCYVEELIQSRRSESLNSEPSNPASVEKSAEEVSTYKSRYLEDFEQMSLLGKGGFGMVFEAKHKIDESHYAVKRIAIPTDRDKRDRFMREIKALSKLDHVGIVRYFNAWIEEPPIGWQEQQDRLQNYEITDTYSTYSRTENMITGLSSKVDFQFSQLKSNDSLEIVFEESGKQISQSKDADMTSDHDETAESKSEKHDAPTDSTVHSTVDEHLSSPRKITPTPKVFVYIQMQLCKKETLKDWLFCNKHRDKLEMIKIFMQLLDAVNYVHSNKLIHRDLKVSLTDWFCFSLNFASSFYSPPIFSFRSMALSKSETSVWSPTPSMRAAIMRKPYRNVNIKVTRIMLAQNCT